MLTTLLQGWPTVLEMGAILPGPPAVAWRLITDWEKQGDWMLEARDFVVTSEQREGIGVTAEATVRIGGITTRDRATVTSWEPERLLGISHEGWVSGRAEMLLTPLDGSRTHILWTEALRPPWGLVGAIGLSAFKPLMRRVFERDLSVLARLTAAAA